MNRPATSGHRVRIIDAAKRYGSVAAIRRVSLDIEPGRFVVLLGPSGSGKSTLVRCLAGIEFLDAGEIRFGDQVVSGPRRHVPAERRDLAMVFQDYALWPHLTALGNVAYALRRRQLDRSETRRLAHEALEQVGLVGLAERYPLELSGGQQQRVGLARAIVARPALLLFDEPLSNLDADLRERMRVEISTLTRDTGSTVIYITHDQTEAFALADEIGILNHGSLEQMASPEQIYQWPATPFVARFTGISGQFQARATRHRDGQLIASVAGQHIHARPAGPIQDDASITVLVRPSATTFLSPGAEPTAGALPATVIDIAYRGRGYDHVIDCGFGIFTSVFDREPWARGTRCWVRMDPLGCTAFASEDPDPQQPALGASTRDAVTPVGVAE